MKHVFIILDCSASIVADGSELVGAINDLLHELINELEDGGAGDIRVIGYGDNASILWQSSSKKSFSDIPEDRFDGRSSLGKAYELIKKTLTAEAIPLKDCAIALISDGEASDDYKTQLQALDPKNEAYRVAIAFGIKHFTTEKHASQNDLFFLRGVTDRDDFIEKTVDYLSL